MSVAGVSRSGSIVAQGQLAVGNATVPFSATSVPCSAVWIGAPTASHTVGEVNTGIILVGGNATSNASGGRPVLTDDHKGVLILVDDLSKLHATGTNAGDVLEYQAIL